MSKEEIIKGLESVKIECGKHLDESFAWICEPIDRAIELINNEDLDQENIFKQLEAEIEWEKEWLASAGYNAYNVGIAFDSIKHILDKAISTKEHFKNHVATLTDYGNIKILDFKEPGTSHYRIRFLFEEDYYRLHISGDLGQLVATNYNNMCYEDFSDFVHNTGYFKGKIDCHDREIYEYDYDKAKQELQERFEDYEVTSEYDWQTDEEYREEKIEEILEDLNTATGLGSKAYDILSEIDGDCWEYIGDIGRVDTGILELYMLAFELAQEQLKEQLKEQDYER